MSDVAAYYGTRDALAEIARALNKATGEKPPLNLAQRRAVEEARAAVAPIYQTLSEPEPVPEANETLH